MSGHFIVKSVKNLNEVKEGDRFEESDFACIVDDEKFVQFKYVEEKRERKPYMVQKGLWTISKNLQGMYLEKTAYIEDNILDTFSNTKNLTTKIDCFFRNLHVYKDFGIEVPRRACLLYGPPGTGKTTSAIKVCQNYTKDDNKTAVIIWSTDKFEAYEIKDFIKRFQYEDVDRLIIVAEDIGGVEIDQVRMKSTASLLSLLDNKEKAFKIPVFIIATTNFPENLLGNLANRPGRFDDKIEMKNPDADNRRSLLEFYAKGKLSKEQLDMIKSKKYQEFSAAHLQEVILRSALHEISFEESLENITLEIDKYKKSFQDKHKLGIGIESEPDYE